MEDDDKPDTPPEHTPEPTHEPVHHVSREEFDSLKGTVDGLIQKVTEVAPPPGDNRDEAPTGKPWTHWGTK